MKKTRKIKTSDGFTLVETLLALVLLSILLAGALNIYFYSNEFLAMAMHKKIVAEIVNSKMEELKETDYAAITSGDFNVKLGENETEGKIIVTPQDGYKEVRVTATWSESGKKDKRDIELVTYIAPKP